EIEIKLKVPADRDEGNVSRSEAPTKIRDKGCRDSRERDYDAVNCPRKDDVPQESSEVNKAQFCEDEGKPEDLGAIDNEERRDKELYDLHREERTLRKYPNKDVPIRTSNELSRPICDKILTVATVEIPRKKGDRMSGTTDETQDFTYNKAPTGTDDMRLNREDNERMTKQTNVTLELTDETLTARKDTRKYPGGTTEKYCGDDKFVENQDGKGNDDGNRILSQPEETEELVAQDLKENRKEMRDQPEGMSSHDRAEDELEEEKKSIANHERNEERFEEGEERTKYEPRQRADRSVQDGSDGCLEETTF
ncbi:11771_t:CDS:1, partial [Acaulospora morrowiae]